MKKLTIFSAVASIILLSSCSKSNTNDVQSETKPQSEVKPVKSKNYQQEVNDDVNRFRAFYSDKFPNIELTEFENGAYAVDKETRDQWLEIEEFPPYELSIDEGEEFFQTPFANGKSYADCFENGGENVRQNYPYFDTEQSKVITLELAINQCRLANNEKALDYGVGELAAVSAYMASTSRGSIFDVKVPNKAAYDAYMNGKKFFYSKRGQLNFSCADCHLKISGSKLRADVLSPAIGHPTGMPVYRSNWGDLGTIGRRYKECNKNVRAEPFAYQSDAYRNLEYFQTIMSNGLKVNGPSSRK